MGIFWNKRVIIVKPTQPATAKMTDGSLVEYLYDPGGQVPYKCGYCKSPDTSLTQGVWAYKMKCRDYQELVDRGFQRSGRYVYRPVMAQTCCPQYVIRMDVREFRANKSQRGVVRKMNKYLLQGLPAVTNDPERATGPQKYNPSGEEVMSESTQVPTMLPPSPLALHEMSASCTMGHSILTDGEGTEQASSSYFTHPPTAESLVKPVCSGSVDENPVTGGKPLSPKPDGKKKKVVRKGIGPDPSKPACRKAKLIRKERRANRLAALQTEIQGKQQTIAQEREPPQLFKQCLEELLVVPHAEQYVHRLSTRLVCCSPRSPEFQETFHESYAVFKKFQMIVHKEVAEDCEERQFLEFLVESPLRLEEGPPGMPGYGSYHQQYLLDGKIFAVGVLDILPKGVLCEYLYYDPAYRFIAPGVYTALHEMAMTQQYCRIAPEMQFYYMGFYVQSCPKMNYKQRYAASYLLCPETYQYVAIEKCIPKLLVSEYSRLGDTDIPNADLELFTEDAFDNILVFADMTWMTYEVYRSMCRDEKRGVVEEYVKLVGLNMAMRLKLYLGRMM